MVLSLRHVLVIFGLLFGYLVFSLNDFDLLYFSFVYMGGLMLVNFLIVTGDIGNISSVTVLSFCFFSFFVCRLYFDYFFLLFVLFLVLVV